MKGNLPLKGIRVIEFEGLAPTVFCGMILADFGADVIIVNRVSSAGSLGMDTHKSFLNRGKRSIAVDLKNPLDRSIVKELILKSDIVIDSFRPGKLEHLGLGPLDVASNPALIFARLTGFGQTGPLKDQAGHDINYLSYSGILSTLGEALTNPIPPNNILADFAGGGAFGVMGILLALFERSKSRKGQVVDISMTDSVAYLSSFLLNMKKNQQYNLPRGSNLLDGSKTPFYRTYKCKDEKFLAVGCLEEEFYQRFLKGLNLSPGVKNRFDPRNYEKLTKLFTERILEKSRDEWMQIFLPLDCCVSPVLEFEELSTSEFSQKYITQQPRQSDQSSSNKKDSNEMPNKFSYTFVPQPILSNHEKTQRSTTLSENTLPKRGQHNAEILEEYQLPENLIRQFLQSTQPKL